MGLSSSLIFQNHLVYIWLNSPPKLGTIAVCNQIKKTNQISLRSGKQNMKSAHGLQTSLNWNLLEPSRIGTSRKEHSQRRLYPPRIRSRIVHVAYTHTTNHRLQLHHPDRNSSTCSRTHTKSNQPLLSLHPEPGMC